MKKIISFCLWGNNEVYNYGMLENAFISKIYYPDYKVYIYHSKDCIKEVIDKLKTMDNVYLIEMDMNKLSAVNTFYRFIPAFEAEKDDIVLIRDSDSLLNKKEMYAVLEFIKSDKQIHIMRDHPCHFSLIMAGMWGCKGDILNKYKDEFYNYINDNINNNLTNKRNIDQIFLNECIYPSIKDYAIIHASHHKIEDNASDFPSNSIDNCEFVGQIIHNFPIACTLLGVENKTFERKEDYNF